LSLPQKKKWARTPIGFWGSHKKLPQKVGQNSYWVLGQPQKVGQNSYGVLGSHKNCPKKLPQNPYFCGGQFCGCPRKNSHLKNKNHRLYFLSCRTGQKTARG